MKTTFDLPDDLVIDAKKRAAELRVPLRALVEAGLRRELDARATQARSRRKKIEWVTVAGDLPPDLDVTNREAMYDWFEKHRNDP